MNRLAQKMGYTYCGVIDLGLLEPDGDRGATGMRSLLNTFLSLTAEG